MRGGAAIYLHTSLNCKTSLSYSNSVVEFIVVKCKNLDTIFICVYQPPRTVNCEWRQAVTKIEEDIDHLQSNGDFKTCGDWW